MSAEHAVGDALRDQFDEVRFGDVQRAVRHPSIGPPGNPDLYLLVLLDEQPLDSVVADLLVRCSVAYFVSRIFAIVVSSKNSAPLLGNFLRGSQIQHFDWQQAGWIV